VKKHGYVNSVEIYICQKYERRRMGLLPCEKKLITVVPQILVFTKSMAFKFSEKKCNIYPANTKQNFHEHLTITFFFKLTNG